MSILLTAALPPGPEEPCRLLLPPADTAPVSLWVRTRGSGTGGSSGPADRYLHGEVAEGERRGSLPLWAGCLVSGPPPISSPLLKSVLGVGTAATQTRLLPLWDLHSIGWVITNTVVMVFKYWRKLNGVVTVRTWRCFRPGHQGKPTEVTLDLSPE